MENINIPVNYVAVHAVDYRDYVLDSHNLSLLKEAALSGIYWKRYSYDNSLEVEYDAKNIMDVLRLMFPDDYKADVEAKKEAFLAAEAKGEEE